MTDDNFHKLALSESFERVAKVAKERDAFNEAMEHVIHSSMPIDFERRYAMDNLIAQDADLLDAEGVKLYWYRQGKDDGVEHERAKIVAWLMREEDDYPSGKYSGFAAMIREEIEAGEHLK